MLKTSKAAVTAALLLLGAAGCADLAVTNDDEPDTARVVGRPADVEQLIINSYLAWWDATHGFVTTPSGQANQPGLVWNMNQASFESSATAANFGGIDRSTIPRTPIGNSTADAYKDFYEDTWYGMYRAIKGANDGIGAIEGGLEIGGSASNTTRAEAFAKFVRAIAHGHLALAYDRAFIVDEPGLTDFGAEGLQPYGAVMESALAQLDEVIALAEANTFNIPEDWINGVPLTNQGLAQLAHSYKARFRAQVARTPAEREAVVWSEVVADANQGITADFGPVMENVNWRFLMHYYMRFYGAWHQVHNFLYGMADQSGEYQEWIDTPLLQRTAFLYITPDQRFPQGATAAAQQENPGKYIGYHGTVGHLQPSRGSWRWSFYGDERFLTDDGYYTTALGTIPIMTVEEMNLLEAEGLYRMGDLDGAAALVNLTRTTVGELAPVTASGVPVVGDACVPRLPDGSCGDLFEALKWEKRIETWGQVWGGWFMDSRGWGDLVEGTAYHYPVPAKELLVLQTGVYTFGGEGGDDSAGPSTYDYNLP